jgi:hypothetical protein
MNGSLAPNARAELTLAASKYDTPIFVVYTSSTAARILTPEPAGCGFSDTVSLLLGEASVHCTCSGCVDISVLHDGWALRTPKTKYLLVVVAGYD